MFCTKCGKKNDDHSKYCEYCGAKLEASPGRENRDQAADGRHREDRDRTTSGQYREERDKTTGGRYQENRYQRAEGGPAGQNRPPKKNQMVLIICIIIAVVAVGVGAGFGIHYFMTTQNSGDAREQERIEAGNSSEEGEFWSASSGDSSDQVPADEEDGTEEPEDTPSPSPTVTSEPTPVITATPEPTPESTIHRYEFVISDEGWGEAFQSCISRGGYLARIETLEEWEEVTRQLEAQGLSENVFYIGGMRNSQSNTYYWVDTSMNLLTDEPVNDSSSPLNGKWLSGEPSYQDGEYQELFLTMYHNSDANDWVLNDVPNDVVGIWSYYSGRMGYICEYES